jgi:hypothetical protein
MNGSRGTAGQQESSSLRLIPLRAELANLKPTEPSQEASTRASYSGRLRERAMATCLLYRRIGREALQRHSD